MFVSANVFVIILHFVALIVFGVAAFVRVPASARYVLNIHWGWFGLFVLTLTTLLADLGVFK